MSQKVEARHWSYKESKEGKGIVCRLCPHTCFIKDNQIGFCGVRENIRETLIASSYGAVTSIVLDPIEKKPLYHFQRGKKIVSIGGYGCNFRCGFCQNHKISMEYQKAKIDFMSPETIVQFATAARANGNIGIAYTYNEPLIGYEFIFDCATLAKKSGLANVLVTNGYINRSPLLELLPLIDAINIDIKAFDDRTYNRFSGTLEPVLDTIQTAHRTCHVELTTLVVPGDNENDINSISKWIAKIDPNIPFHLSRFFPRHKYINAQQTPKETMHRAKETAEKYLTYVYLGNM
ncbi:MAG: AmmeMemoRadiSam system radical SAM enzyme [Oscillospiraceae bacterium]|nr:AmmeMemoRadiSam system radical SAM enzyme [Oscillospiraceae bacterium]MCL2278458.1 AmmeMemoRadiSam system radical SAM enzyme [Oscillospiraceae bacterium]